MTISQLELFSYLINQDNIESEVSMFDLENNESNKGITISILNKKTGSTVELDILSDSDSKNQNSVYTLSYTSVLQQTLATQKKEFYYPEAYTFGTGEEAELTDKISELLGVLQSENKHGFKQNTNPDFIGILNTIKS